MTSIITGGVVSVEDGVKAKEEYAPARKVRVELHFDVPEGEDAEKFFNGVAAMANAKVKALLSADKGFVALDNMLAAKELTDKDRAAIAAGVQVAPEAEKTVKKPPKKAKEPETPPAEEDVMSDVVVEEPEDSLDDILGEAEAPPKPISDADLHDAIGKKNATLKAPPKIRELIKEFAPDKNGPVYSSGIPQKHRRMFLDRLAALS